MAENTPETREIAQRWLYTNFQIDVPMESPVVAAVLQDTTKALASVLSLKLRKDRKMRTALPRLIEALQKELKTVVTAKPLAAAPASTEAPRDENLEEYHARIDAKFDYIALADCTDESSLPEILRSPLVAANLRVLRQAEKMGVTHTTLCLPKNGPISHVAGYIPLKHFDTSLGRLNENGIAASMDLYPLYTLLVQCPEARIHHEGMPFDVTKMYAFQRGEERNALIPGTNIKIFSEEGQKMLFEQPDVLLRTIRHRNHSSKDARSEFHQIFWHQSGDNVYGDQSEQAHVQTCEAATEWFRNQGVASQYDGALNQIGHGVRFGVSKNLPRQIYVAKPGMNPDTQGISPATAYIFDLQKMIQDIETYLRTIRHYTVMNRKREEEILHRMTGVVPKGYDCDTATIPHVIYGVGHKHEILNNAADNGVAVILTTPDSLKNHKEEEGRFYADKRNRMYHAISNDILPILKQALESGERNAK